MMNRDTHFTRRVTLEVLDRSRDLDTSEELDRILDSVVRLYGEDALREFVRLSVHHGMPYDAAGKHVFSDAALGNQTGIVVSRVVSKVEP